MSEHPGDSPLNRFRAFWTGLLAFVGFGLVLWLVLKAAGPRDVVEPGWAERGEERAAVAVEVAASQEAALSPDLQGAVKATVTSLQGKEAAKSEIVVPGSATFLKQSQQPATEEPAAPEGGDQPAEAADPAPAPEKPAAPKPAEAAAPAPEKPAEEKPAEEKPAAEKPAAEANPEKKDAPAAQ